MSKYIFFMLAVSFVHLKVTYGHPGNLGTSLMRNIGKSFEADFDNHMKTVQEVHAPFVATFKNTPCDYPTGESMLDRLGERIRQCVQLTNDVGDLESRVLYIYDLAGNYTRLSLEATQNVTVCLEKKDLVLVTVCLLQEGNYFNDQVQQLNEVLRETILYAKYAESNIVQSFSGCFGTSVLSLQEITKTHSKICKTK